MELSSGEVHVSGNIYRKPDQYKRLGWEYMVYSPSMCWGMSSDRLTPDDLREMADDMEALEKNCPDQRPGQESE